VEYFSDRNLLLLKAENPKYETLTYSNNELNQIRILGKAVVFQSDVR
jgi:repressor LexA